MNIYKTKVKTYYSDDLLELDENINNFLSKDKIVEVIDIKFNVNDMSESDGYHTYYYAMVIYKE